MEDIVQRHVPCHSSGGGIVSSGKNNNKGCVSVEGANFGLVQEDPNRKPPILRVPNPILKQAVGCVGVTSYSCCSGRDKHRITDDGISPFTTLPKKSMSSNHIFETNQTLPTPPMFRPPLLKFKMETTHPYILRGLSFRNHVCMGIYCVYKLALVIQNPPDFQCISVLSRSSRREVTVRVPFFL